MTDLNALLEPGMLVRHPEQPDWGLGQVQSNIRGKITVNFEHIKTHYYFSHTTINPTQVVPLGPVVDYSRPHDRGALKGAA